MFSADNVVYNGGSCCYLRTQRADGGSNLATQKTIVTAMMLRRGWKQRQVTKQTQCKQETSVLQCCLYAALTVLCMNHRTSAPVGPQVLPRLAVLVLCRVQLQAKRATSYSAVVIEKYMSLEKVPALIYYLHARLHLYNLLAPRNLVLLELYILRRDPLKLIVNLLPIFTRLYL